MTMHVVHLSLIIHEFLVKHEITLVPQPPYSPDLVPLDFLFPELIHSERSPISNDRRNIRKFATRPMHHFGKRVPELIPEIGRGNGGNVGCCI